MTTTMEKIEKLSKAEILALLRNTSFWFSVTDYDILMARHDVLWHKGVRMSDDALADMQKWSKRNGVKARIEWLKASDRCARGFNMQDNASRLLENIDVEN
jgi:hypothetical protein